MKQNTKRFSSLIVALIGLVGAIIVYFDLVVPAYQDLQDAKGVEVSQANLLDNERQIVSQVQNLVKAYGAQSQGKQSVSMALPVGADVAGALTQVSGLAAANTITIQSMGISAAQAPQASAGGGPVRPIAASSSIATAASAGAVVKPAAMLSFQITATGSYENFKNFLKGIETNVRLFDVKGVSIHEGNVLPNARGSVFIPNNFSYTITLAAYYQSS